MESFSPILVCAVLQTMIRYRDQRGNGGVEHGGRKCPRLRALDYWNTTVSVSHLAPQKKGRREESRRITR